MCDRTVHSQQRRRAPHAPPRARARVARAVAGSLALLIMSGSAHALDPARDRGVADDDEASTRPADRPAPAPEPHAPAPDPDAPPPPPPPKAEGDYAGHGAPKAGRDGSEGGSEPQSDFTQVEQEYKRPQKHEFSVRFDPLNWLLLGRLNIELEASVWRFLSVELIPTFVTARSPIALNYARLDNTITQHSNGIGPLSGARIGVGVWLSGEPFSGYVLRLSLTNYGYEYRAADKAGVFDRVDFTERRVMGFFGSHSRFGAFTFAGGFGLGYELHAVERCGLSMVSTKGSSSGGAIAGRTSGCHGRQQIALDRDVQETEDLNGPLHPIYFEARFSLGVVF